MGELVQSKKIMAWSAFLGRDFHADLFKVGAGPAELLIMLFGGSGMTADEYRQRGKSIIPVFSPALHQLAADHSLVFVYVSAPYDVPFRFFSEDEDACRKWLAHAEDELIPACSKGLPPDMPLYFIGYSGGMALAVNGLHLLDRCKGVGGLGADGIPDDLEAGPSWLEPLRLYYNTGDRVFRANAELIRLLDEEMLVRCFRRLSGGHDLTDYVKNESFSGLIRSILRLLHTSAT